MIAIKILCGCGQKYAFDCEPDRGQVAYAVACPTCGADGTSVANDIIARQQDRTSIPHIELRPSTNSVPYPPRAAYQLEPVRGKKGLPVALVCLAVAVASIGAAALALKRSHESKETASQFVAPESGDLPRTRQELNTSYAEPPRGQNAATFFAEGLEGLRFENVSSLPLLGKGKLPPFGVSLSGPIKSGIAALLNENREALLRFDEGSSYEQSRYPIDLTLGFETILPHLPNFRRAAQLEELAAILHADEQNAAQASRDLHVAIALGRSLEDEPQLLSQNARVATTAIVLSALEQTLNRVSLPADASSGLLNDLRKMNACDEHGGGFDRALAAERLDGLATLTRPGDLLAKLSGPRPQLPMPPEDCKSWIAALQKPGNVKDQQQFYTELFDALIVARKQSFPARLRSDDLIRQKTVEATTRQFGIARLLMPALTDRATREGVSVAYGRLGLTAVALEQFRMAHQNHFPGALSELTPEASTLAVDPFDGQSLRYRQQGRGYVIYSIGSDRQDDSGDRSRDIVFTIAAVPKVLP